MANAEIADILERIAEYLEIQGIAWKPKAYKTAALNINSLSKDLREIYKEEGIKGLEKISGIGEHIARKIEEYLKTGKVHKLEELKKKIPIKLEELSSIEGLGPKKIMALYKKLGVKDIKDLKEAINSGKLRALPSFGEKTEENLLKSISFQKSSGERKPFFYALNIAEGIAEQLRQINIIDEVFIAGSIARRKETIGDIDILISAVNPKEALKNFAKGAKVERMIAEGGTKLSLITQGMHVDVRAVNPNEFGSAKQYFVGSKQHNIETRKIAIKKGLKLSEYGLFRGNKRIAGANEEEIYKKLGMDWIPYELRENSGEIEAAQNHKLPRLIELKDIQGDLQMHTTYSDGADSIEEMALRCKELGYKYCCITDHVGQIKIAGAMSEKEIIKQGKEIEKVNDKLQGFKVLHGAEVDILLNGKLAASDKILKNFDIVLGGIHLGLTRDKEAQTKRTIEAMKNKHMNIMAHPTGRILGQRAGYELDWEKVFVAAKENNIALEINAYPTRMDLNDTIAREAKNEGIMLSIGTDSHSTSQFDSMKYGIFIARRAWCEPKNILNTLSPQKLLERLKK